LSAYQARNVNALAREPEEAGAGAAAGAQASALLVLEQGGGAFAPGEEQPLSRSRRWSPKPGAPRQ